MAGYSGTPLGKKLGLKESYRCRIVNAPDDYFNWISPLPPALKTTARMNLDFVHLFVKDLKTFSKQFQANRKLLKKDGMMWISWPKRSAKVPTDLDENIIRDFGLRNGLVDVKVCAVDETWSGLKFVYRLSDR